MSRRGETVILAAGDFPEIGSEACRLLDEADRVVCCDGAATEYRLQTGCEPDVIVGDMDSLEVSSSADALTALGGAEIVRIYEQETNDLAKAVRLCAERGWENPIILGATGKREDHTLGNIFRALEFGLEIVTDHGRFIPVEGSASIAIGKGAAVSIFATDRATRIASKGLEWPLDGVCFDNLYCATLNRAVSDVIELETTRRVYVFVSATKG